MKTKTIFLIISILLVSFSAAFAGKPTKPPKPVGQTKPVDLGTAGTFAILTKTGITTDPASDITGNIGVSPIAATSITGFGTLPLDASGEYSTSPQVTGKVFAADYTEPTPTNLGTAIGDMETAYTNAAGRSPGTTELGAGNISGLTLKPGVYAWGTGVLINSDVTLKGNSEAVFIFQIAQTLTQAADTSIILTGGVEAKNIFWQVAETVAIGAGAHFEGVILAKTDITMGSEALVNGRLLAQSNVTLIANTVVAPKVKRVK